MFGFGGGLNAGVLRAVGRVSGGGGSAGKVILGANDGALLVIGGTTFLMRVRASKNGSFWAVVGRDLWTVTGRGSDRRAAVAGAFRKT